MTCSAAGRIFAAPSFRPRPNRAQIGVAKADLYPAFSLSGSFGFLATDVGNFRLTDMFQWGSRTYQIGPSFQWNLFNYGRITNNVRVQDARFEQLLIAYQNAVLKAQQEVEDALVAFLRAQDRAAFLAQSPRPPPRMLSTSPSCSIGKALRISPLS